MRIFIVWVRGGCKTEWGLFDFGLIFLVAFCFKTETEIEESSNSTTRLGLLIGVCGGCKQNTFS